MVVVLARWWRIEGHRQRRAGERRRVEGRHPDRAVAADLDVRLDRPDRVLALAGRAGDVDEVRDGLRADEHGSAGERHEAEEARVAEQRLLLPSASRTAMPPAVAGARRSPPAARSAPAAAGRRRCRAPTSGPTSVASTPERSRVVVASARASRRRRTRSRRSPGRLAATSRSRSLPRLVARADVARRRRRRRRSGRGPRRCPRRRWRCRRSRGAGSDRRPPRDHDLVRRSRGRMSIGGPAGGARPSGEASRPASS